MSDYTPTTEEVRDYNNWLAEEFDRWLAEVLREAKAEAWYIGASTAVNYALNGSESLPENPYEQGVI